MANQQTKTARDIAMKVLNQFDPRHDYASQILNKFLPKTTERQRATDLVFGTLRNLVAIDTAIAKFTECPVKRIPPKILNIIRIGAYELIYAPETPEYSIVNEAVENTKTITGKKQVGFVNAALRQITRHITNRQIQLSQANSQRTLLQTPTTGCEFDMDILPDPKASPADYLNTAFSLPKWLVADWLGEFGKEQTTQICFASNRRPSIYIRPNPLKITAKKLVEKLHQENVDCEIIESTMIKLKSPKGVSELPGFAEGLFSVQDLISALPVRLLNPKPHWKILDLCAAPGTKTTQLAELTGDKATIIATDIDSQRLEKVKENIARLGLKSVTIVEYAKLSKISNLEFRISDFTIDPVDCVLLDVPCSNTAVLARRIEARYRLTPKAIEKLVKVQSDLLEKTTKLLKPKGKICYCTCSIQKKENGEVIKDFLRKNPNFKLESEKLILPSTEEQEHDGGYVAILSS